MLLNALAQRYYWLTFTEHHQCHCSSCIMFSLENQWNCVAVKWSIKESRSSLGVLWIQCLSIPIHLALPSLTCLIFIFDLQDLLTTDNYPATRLPCSCLNHMLHAVSISKWMWDKERNACKNMNSKTSCWYCFWTVQNSRLSVCNAEIKYTGIDYDLV